MDKLPNTPNYKAYIPNVIKDGFSYIHFPYFIDFVCCLGYCCYVARKTYIQNTVVVVFMGVR